MPLARVWRLRQACTRARCLYHYRYARREVPVAVIPYKSDSESMPPLSTAMIIVALTLLAEDDLTTALERLTLLLGHRACWKSCSLLARLALPQQEFYQRALDSLGRDVGVKPVPCHATVSGSACGKANSRGARWLHSFVLSLQLLIGGSPWPAASAHRFGPPSGAARS